MLVSGKAMKVTLYLSEGVKYHGIPIYSSILDVLFHSGIGGATGVRGVAGFGAKHRMHAAHLLDISDHLPLRVECIERREKMDAILQEAQNRTGSGRIELQETEIIVPTRD